MNTETIKNTIEAALLCAGRPMELNELLRMFDEAERPARKDALAIIESLREEYAARPIELIEVASGFRVQVREDFSEPLGRLSERRAPRYSRALLETLVLVAYRQPVTRGEIENVRGVSVSSTIVRTLLERGWVRIVGHRDVPGRPAMLGTTKEFLDYFNLKSLDELPSLAELKDFDSINVEMDFDSDGVLIPQLAGPAGDESEEDAQELADVADAADAAMDARADDDSDADATTEATAEVAADEVRDGEDDAGDVDGADECEELQRRDAATDAVSG